MQQHLSSVAVHRHCASVRGVPQLAVLNRMLTGLSTEFLLHCTTRYTGVTTDDTQLYLDISSLYNHGTNITTIDSTQWDLDMT